jgi:hypothetical protein
VALAVSVGLVLTFAASPASAKPTAGGCTSTPVSAIDQYCEILPSATGGNAPGPGSPAVALPPKVAGEIAASGTRSPRRRLLTVPAASRHVAIVGPASASSPWLLLLLIVLAILLALAAIATARWRRRPRPA